MHTARVTCISLGIYLFGIVYSPGEGPVPFTYSAEAYPLCVRTYGMSLATSTTGFSTSHSPSRGPVCKLPLRSRARLLGM